MVSGPKAFSKSDTVFGPAFGGLLRDLHRRHEVTEDVSRCQEIGFLIDHMKKRSEKNTSHFLEF